MSEYDEVVKALDDEIKFPFGICPYMSKLHVVVVPAGGPIHTAQPAMQQQLIFSPVACVGRRCQLWQRDGSEVGCGAKIRERLE
jgi:hypothetical protein